MELIKQSIFKIRTYEYDIKFSTANLNLFCANSDSSYRTYDCAFKTKTNTYTEEKLIVGIPSPLLSVGDKFYLEEKDTFLSIEEVIRTDKDNVCYIVENLNQECISETSKKQYEADKAVFFDVTKHKDEVYMLKKKLKKIKDMQEKISEARCFKRNKMAYDFVMSFEAGGTDGNS